MHGNNLDWIVRLKDVDVRTVRKHTTVTAGPGHAHLSRARVTGQTDFNVVLIFMDDHTWWAIGALEQQPIHTPNLDRLVHRGTTYTHAFNQGSWAPAVCVPARAMVLSGRTLFDAQRGLGSDEMDPAVTPIGAAFRRAGYRSYFTGKWHNPVSLLDVSYDARDASLKGMLPVEQSSRPWDPSDTALGGHWMTDDDGSVIHSSERWTNSALSYLTDHRRNHPDQPFFLHIAYHAPHDPRQSPRRWIDHYRHVEIPLPPNFCGEHPFDQGDHLIRDELLAPFPRSPERIRQERAEYFAIVSHADEQIGRVLDELDRLDLTKDTIICFSGDHGLALGEHGLLGKQSLYDHSVRVPLIFAGPGIAAGVRRDELTYQASLHPTLLTLAGVPANPDVQFAPLTGLTDAAKSDHGEERIFLAYRDLQRAIRTERWSLHQYQPSAVTQLFDLHSDPWQQHNRADDPEFASVLADLRSQLVREQSRLGDPSGAWRMEAR